MVGKPDKMACRSAPKSQSRTVTSLRDHFELSLKFAPPWQCALATGLLSRCKSCFVVGQVLSLLRVADEARCRAWPLLGWAGCTAGFLSTPLLVCTAVSRGKDDHYRGVFPRVGGEFYFWWSEFWTVEKKGGRPQHSAGPGSLYWAARMYGACGSQLLRLGSWVTTSSETAKMQVWPSNWIRSAEYAVSLISPDFVRSRVITFRMGPPRRSCAVRSSPVCRIVPNPELVHGTPQHLFPAKSVPAFKGGIHFQKTSLLKGRDRERYRTRVKYVLKFLLGNPAIGL